MSEIVDVLARHVNLSPGETSFLHARFADLERVQETSVTTLKGASISTGNVDISPNGLYLFYQGHPTIALEPDGDAFFGSDITDKSKTSLVIFANAQRYGGEYMGAGDLLIGDNSDEKSNIHYDASLGTLNFRVGDDIKLYVDTAGDLVLEGVIRSDNYVSFVSGFEIDAQSGDAEFNNCRIRGSMIATVLQFDNLHALGGNFGVYKSASKVNTGFTTAAQSSTTTARVDNDPSGTALFAALDYVYCSFFNGTSVKAGYMKVTVVGANSGDYTTYTLETISAPIASTYIPEGTPIADYGVTGDGRIMLRGGQQPNIDIGTFDSSGPNIDSNLRAGDLDGVLGISTTTFGFACGDLGGSSTDYFLATSSGIEIASASGGVIINEDGIQCVAQSDTWYDYNEYQLVYDGDTIGSFGGYYDTSIDAIWVRLLTREMAGTHSYLKVTSEAPTDHIASLQLFTSSGSNNISIDIVNKDTASGQQSIGLTGGFVYITDSLHVGGVSDAGNDNLWVDGFAEIEGGLHIGTQGTDPGDDNLLVDGITNTYELRSGSSIFRTRSRNYPSGDYDSWQDVCYFNWPASYSGCMIRLRVFRTQLTASSARNDYWEVYTGATVPSSGTPGYAAVTLDKVHGHGTAMSPLLGQWDSSTPKRLQIKCNHVSTDMVIHAEIMDEDGVMVWE